MGRLGRLLAFREPILSAHFKEEIKKSNQYNPNNEPCKSDIGNAIPTMS